MKAKPPATQIERSYPRGLRTISKTDLKGVITYVNDQFIEMRGFSKEELIGDEYNFIPDPDTPHHAFNWMKGAFNDEDEEEEEKVSPQSDLMSIELALELATSHSQAGEPFDVELLYQMILQSDQSLPLFPNYKTSDLEPSDSKIDYLISLFHAGNYAEMEGHAQILVEQYPCSGIVWKAYGAALQAQGKNALHAFQKSTELLPEDAEAQSNLGNALQDSGLLQESIAYYRRALELDPFFAEAFSNLGNALHDLGRKNEAVENYLKALEIKPDYVEAHFNLGNALQDLGQFDHAVTSYQRTLELRPDYAAAHNNLGNAQQSLGLLKEAVASYHKAMSFNSEYAEALNNLGNALQSFGQIEFAIISYRRALEIKPDYAEAHNNLGNAFYDLERMDEAEASYKQALLVRPDYTDALNNLALLFNAQDMPRVALELINQSLAIKETAEAKSIFVACIKRLRFTRNDDEIRAPIVRALKESWGRPTDLARISVELVKLNPDIFEFVSRASDLWPDRVSMHELLGMGGFKTLAEDTLLCTLLDTSPLCDIEVERFLALARYAMLEIANEATMHEGESDSAIRFFSSLARQCFINEYVFPYTIDEMQQASDLRGTLVSSLEADDPVPVIWPVAVAAYFPLNSLPSDSTERLLERQWPEEVSSVLKQQISEPAEERKLSTTIPRLTKVEDKVSLQVQRQYEMNPYPRWMKVAPSGKTKNFIGYFCQKFPLADFSRQFNSSNVEILIAGCGTGQHSIETAQQFQWGLLLAIDLSISSLAYAKRKSKNMGLTLIEYAQADILALGSLDRTFDIIESSGVLHHLGDPWTGWRVLLSLLRPNGFMKLGFYSKVARQNIIKTQAFIVEQGYGSTAEEIRRCRQDLIDLAKTEDFAVTLKSSDFYSISTCRDLLFHVMEHQMTLTRIEAFLLENNLTFMGFEIEGSILHAYKRRFPDDQSATDLAQWQLFENENPDTFANMYQFWIQKMS